MAERLARVGAVLLLLAVVTSTFAGSVAAADAEQVTLTITVVDGDGDPVPNADLTATWDGGGPVEETTRSNGQALIDVEAGADVTIRVDHPDYVRNEPYVVRNASGENVEIEVARKGTATVTVEGPDGPVPNAIVRLFQQGGGLVVNARTDDQGRLSTQAIERGRYTMVVFKAGYLRNTSTVRVDGDVSRTVEIETGSVLVNFEVRDPHFDPPRTLQNATISIEGLGSVTTLGNGEASVTVPVNQQFTISVTKPGYETVQQTLDVRESPMTRNISIVRVPSLTVSPSNDRVVVGENVTVRVTDEYGDPVEGALVRIDAETVGETNAEGVIEVPVESAGNHTVVAQNAGLRTETVVEGVEAGGDDTPTATPTPTPTPTPEPTTTPGSGPGFGAVGVLLAVTAVALLARRRR